MKKYLYLEAIASVVASHVKVISPENAIYQSKRILSTNIWVGKNTSRTWTTWNSNTHHTLPTTGHFYVASIYYSSGIYLGIHLGRSNVIVCFHRNQYKRVYLAMALFPLHDFDLVCICFGFTSLKSCLTVGCPSSGTSQFLMQKFCKLTTWNSFQRY